MIDLDRPYELTQEQVDCFWRDGFLKLDHVFSAETMSHLRGAIGEAVDQHYATLHTTTNPNRSFSQLFNVWVDSVEARRLTFSATLGGLACQLLSVEGVRVLHDQALFKEPGNRRTIWHADQHYWPIDSELACSFWLPLQPTSLQMGPVSFATGSHRFAGRRIETDQELDEAESDAWHRRVIEQEGYEVVEHAYELGDLSVHAGWTLHQAGSNRTDSVRGAYVLHVMDSEARLAAPANPEQQGHVELFHWGSVAVGDRLEVPMCPLIVRQRRAASPSSNARSSRPKTMSGSK